MLPASLANSVTMWREMPVASAICCRVLPRWTYSRCRNVAVRTARASWRRCQASVTRLTPGRGVWGSTCSRMRRIVVDAGAELAGGSGGGESFVDD